MNQGELEVQLRKMGIDLIDLVSGPSGQPVGAAIPADEKRPEGEWIAFPRNPEGPGYWAPMRGATRAEAVALIGGETETEEATSDIALAWWHLNAWGWACIGSGPVQYGPYALQCAGGYFWDNDLHPAVAGEVTALALRRYQRSAGRLPRDPGDSTAWQVRDVTAQRHEQVAARATRGWNAPEIRGPRAALIAGLMHIYASTSAAADVDAEFVTALGLYIDCYSL